jgi:catechol-2,3-dioxygenase
MNPKLHISLNVRNLGESLPFYDALFGVAPTKVKPGYAKYDVAEPGVVLSLQENQPCCITGVSHLGVRVESTEQVLQARARLNAAGILTRDEIDTTCCHAVQDKIWLEDPTGYRWEIYAFKGDVEQAVPAAGEPKAAACCA